MALTKSAETYSKLKDSHWLVHWALTTAESSFESATRQAVPIAAPIARKLEDPIHFVDHTLCLGLDKIEQRVPLVKEKPEQILANAYILAVKKVQPAVTTICNVNDALVGQATNLRDISWNKANQILETHYGTAAVKGLDNTAILVDNLIDAYFPAVGEESQQTDSIAETEEEDKLLHTLQTVGRLSNKATRRVYVNVIHRTRTLNKDSLRNYVAFLLEFLQLTQYIHAINEKVIDLTSPCKCEKKKEQTTNNDFTDASRLSSHISKAIKMADAKPVQGSGADIGGPHLEVLNRVKNIPVISTAMEKTGSTYSYLKDSHHLINWALNYAEAGLHYATATAAPFAKKFEGQINAMDQKLCEGLDMVEQKVPIVKQPPQQIYDASKAVMSSSLHPTIEKLHAAKESATQHASALKEMSISKANELLSTQFGSMAVQGVDNTSILINRLLDYYFPAVEGEESTPNPVSADENKILHTVQTIGQLSTKTAHRVYHSVVAQLKTIKKEDVAQYMSSVVSILHLTQFLASGQEQTEENANEPSKDKKKEEEEKKK
ncbi:hypothetical protein KPH14_004206 [Odynerus spinipes]|uniref:Uncharacterized protein n=1 Tax=Odynerus spinipes TaxID=1348599 RepID=A0AAD9RZP7_9HYME|nr:hypothetical protein KPH14_004206 [Odynerus spinipes]